MSHIVTTTLSTVASKSVHLFIGGGVCLIRLMYLPIAWYYVSELLVRDDAEHFL